MTTPARRPNARQGALPAPELVSLTDGPMSPRRATEGAWWDEYGGQLDPVSGVVAFPPNSLPLCPFPCELCIKREGA